MKRKGLFVWYILFSALLSVSICLMQLVSTLAEAGAVIWLYADATAFWLGLLGTIAVTVLILLRGRKKHEKTIPGIIRFFRNKYSAVFDLLMLLFAIAVTLLLRLRGNNHVTFCCMGGLTFCFCMHCMLNGVNFQNCLYSDKNRER